MAICINLYAMEAITLNGILGLEVDSRRVLAGALSTQKKE